MNDQPVMAPWFKPWATALSLVATEAAVVVATAPEFRTMLDPSKVGLDRFFAGCTFFVASMGAFHLSLSRSLLPAVDSPK